MIKVPIWAENIMFELPTTIFKDEKSFTTRLGARIDEAWWFWHKISDMSADNKPSDSIVGINWLCWLLEIKHWHEKNKVDVYKKLRNNQTFFLRRRKKNGGLSIVIYYNTIHHKYWIFEFDEEMQLVFSE